MSTVLRELKHQPSFQGFLDYAAEIKPRLTRSHLLRFYRRSLEHVSTYLRNPRRTVVNAPLFLRFICLWSDSCCLNRTTKTLSFLPYYRWFFGNSVAIFVTFVLFSCWMFAQMLVSFSFYSSILFHLPLWKSYLTWYYCCEKVELRRDLGISMKFHVIWCIGKGSQKITMLKLLMKWLC